MDRSGRMTLRLAVGGYLIYLGWSLISGQMAGGTGMNGLLSYGGGTAMILGGTAFGLFAIREYRLEKNSTKSPQDEGVEEAENE